MAERTVQTRSWWYTDPTRRKGRQTVTLRRGDTIDWDDLSDKDQDRAQREFAFAPDEQFPDEPQPEERAEYDFYRMTVAELSEWLTTEEPNVTETVEAMDNDPEVAARMLEAEESATGGEVRKGVETAAKKIIG